MNPLKRNQTNRPSIIRSRKFRMLLAGIVILTACFVLSYGLRPILAPAGKGIAADTPLVTPAPVQRAALDFHMTSLEQGWIRFTDKVMMTDDGGWNWHEASPDYLDANANQTQTGNSVKDAFKGRTFSVITFANKEHEVKKTQFFTDRIAWVLLSYTRDFPYSLLVTADGGQTWQTHITPEIRAAAAKEKKQQQLIAAETALYGTPEIAQVVMDSPEELLPDTAAPGDVVLVRQNKQGQVVWQGKTYTLEPFGAGYYTYLPIPIQLKPGEYRVGEKLLTIKQKKFETQYLEVTKQMESMRQDTKRIQDDQKKIDLARSKSEPEFLFSSAFIQPVEGRLSTPFGHTRYVNGKYDSSHRAIDLAAKSGTPIKATNDGIVVLAESLYLTGNAIYIDHGMGLFSQYAHLSELHVKTGDRVKGGDIIGLVGSTGFSTGPHLHFAFWAHNVPVNPNLFFNTTPFHWLREETLKER